MRRLPEVFLFAVLGLTVLSCASGPQQKTSQQSQQDNPPPATSPVAQPSQAMGGRSPAEDSLPPEQASQGTADRPDVALGLPAAPQSRTGPEVESVKPAGSPETENFPLTVPQPPPAGAGGKNDLTAARAQEKKPAAGAARPKASAARPAAGAQQPAASAGQQAGAEKQPAGAQQGLEQSAQPQGGSSAASASTGAQTGAPPTYGKLREIYARQGDDVQIGLDGLGFLFLGFPDRGPDGDGMSFKGKDTRDGKTWFSFKALKLGTYDLDFLRQDNSTGTSSKETVRVHVVSDADFSAAVAQGQQQTPASAEVAGDPAFAAKLSSVGQYDAAIAELLKGYREGNPGLNDQIAQLYFRTGAYDAAGKYFTKNLAERGQYGDSAVIGLARIAVIQKDQPQLLSLLRRLLAVKDPGLEEALIAAVRLEREKQEAGLGIDLATEYISRYSDGRWRDEADYLLAQLLEQDSQFRDLARARATYKEILDKYPESAFASRARQRIGYIDRHFFEIR
ncbi:MAG: hypothetical protein ABSG38_10595 [Spirochaetia bacterium]